MVKRLKKQLSASRRKEKATRNKLKAALSKVKKAGRAFERKMAAKGKEISSRIAAAEANVYHKLTKALKSKAKKVKARKPKKAKAASMKSKGKAVARKRRGGRRKSRR